MADCPPFVIWNPVQPGSKLFAQSSATDGGEPSKDYVATVHIVLPAGGTKDWTTADLDPDAAGPLELTSGAYGFTGTITSGPTGPAATLRIWIEGTTFDCTWTNAEAGTPKRVNGTIAVVSA